MLNDKTDIKIIEVNNKATKKKFIKFPFDLYKNDSFWVPPLISEQKKLFNEEVHPFFKHSKVKFYLAERDGKICGRIVGIVNYNHINYHNEQVGFFFAVE